jgi:hypothetical protein
LASEARQAVGVPLWSSGRRSVGMWSTLGVLVVLDLLGQVVHISMRRAYLSTRQCSGVCCRVVQRAARQASVATGGPREARPRFIPRTLWHMGQSKRVGVIYRAAFFCYEIDGANL